MLLGLPKDLAVLVASKFAAAKETGALVFSATQLSIIRASGIPFQLRYWPALAKKPTQQQDRPEQTQASKKPNPFQDPSPDLLIAEIPHGDPSHILVLNKYPVIPHHFILATKAFKPQTHLLEEGDLDATYACLKAWEHGSQPVGAKKLFAFFNSGEHSGASQPHRHVQFLPVEDMQEGDSEWSLLIDQLVRKSNGFGEPSQDPELPFAHFVVDIPIEASSAVLLQKYHLLYNAAVKCVQSSSESSGEEHVDNRLNGEGFAAISYNLALTTSAMAICPRKSEAANLSLDLSSGSKEDANIGSIALNGTILAGTLMVKGEAEWSELRREQSKLNRLLGDVGFPFREARRTDSTNRL